MEYGSSVVEIMILRKKEFIKVVFVLNIFFLMFFLLVIFDFFMILVIMV